MSFDLEEFLKKYDVHPEAESYFRKRQAAGGKNYMELGPVEARLDSIQRSQEYGGTTEFTGTDTDFIVPSPDCKDGIPVSVYRPTSCDGTPSPSIVVYFHGGGNVVGCRKTHETVCKILASVAYLQVLVSPNVNFATSYKSLEEFGNMPLMSKSSINWSTEQYITEKDYTNPRASPLLYKDFSAAPATLMIVAELDPLRDGCYAYYEKLKQSGVKAQILTIKGVPEGFWMYPGAFKDCCRRAHEKAAKFMKAHS